MSLGAEGCFAIAKAWAVHNENLRLVDLVDGVVASEEQKVFGFVSSMAIRVLPRHKKCVEEIRVVVMVIYVGVVGFVVAAAKSLQAVDMVRVPIPQVFEI